MVNIEGEIAKLERIAQNLRDLRSRVPGLYGFEDYSKFINELEVILNELEDTSYRLRQILKLKQVI